MVASITTIRTTALERTATEATGGGGGASINFTGQIFTLDSAVIKTQNEFSSHGGFLTYTMYHHRETTRSISKL